jgi:acyl-CoA synthetase (NDP forming)
MTPDWTRVQAIVEAARARGADTLLDTEGIVLLEAMGFRVPAHRFVRDSGEAASFPAGPVRGDRAVVKVVSPRILHKSDVGGVAVVPNRADAIAGAVRDMEARLGGCEIIGFTINELIAYDRGLGHELLVGLRWTDDFGPVVTFGPGGIYTEFLANHFRPGSAVALFSPGMADPRSVEEAVCRVAVTKLLAGRLRGREPEIAVTTIRRALETFMALGTRRLPAPISECEINPLVVFDGELVALDVLVKLGAARAPESPPRPVRKLKQLLEPQSAAIVGVSEKLNPGHIILNNLIREGFDRDRIRVVKPGAASIEGCVTVPDIASLPERVDLFILAISAAQAPGAIAEIIEGRKAETLIVIPGGLEEKQGTEALVSQMRAALARARASDWQGPLINGGNCLGIRSLPGRYDTMFIPEYKLPLPRGQVSPVAIVSQSGAFAVSRTSRLGVLNPKYSITVGNQMDLTIGDYLTYLKDDRDLRVYAVYVEGFRPLDGLRFLEAAREITSGGRSVILYRAGRTAAGAQASASHTASIAGDYAVTRELAKAAGVVVAESLQDFEDLTRLFTCLQGTAAAGWRLGAVSNAGFECVAIADNLGRFELASFEKATAARLQAIFRNARIDSVVDVHNPLDLTPMTGDAAYEEVVRAVLQAPEVDAAIVGCVPLTVALNSLPAGAGHGEDLSRDGSIARRLTGLRAGLTKPWVAVIDAGALYDPLSRALEEGGVPTFREADRALRLLNVYCAHRTATQPAAC